MNGENNEPIKEEDGKGFGLIITIILFVGIITALFFVLKSNPDLSEKPRMEAAPTLEELSEKDGVTIIENGDGTYTVIDFKTDNVNATDGAQILHDRYFNQLSFYCRAVEDITKKKVSGAVIFSFALMDCIEVKYKSKI